MRIISGTRRGLKLVSLEGDDTRPTLDRVKEALFSMLIPYLGSARVLDLFAGSGALGIESLSRGASSAVFVDSHSQAMSIVKENVSRAKFEDRASFYQMSASDFLKKADGVFDIVFLDPPYKGNLYEDSLKKLYENKLINEDSVVILEWDSALERPIIPQYYSVLKERKYGRVMITLLTTGCE